jgi:glycosyltransferase involved in cell wall biosynthesis
MKIAVIVPFYNEAGNLPFFINEWETFLYLNKKLKNKLYFFFIDDGSTDNSLTKIRENIKSLKFKIIKKKNSGHGDSCRFGYSLIISKYKKFEYLMQIDSDNQCDPKYVVNLYNLIKKRKHKFIFGYRRNREDGKIRYVISRIFSLIFFIKKFLYIKDLNTPYRLMRIFELEKILNIISNNNNYKDIKLFNCILSYVIKKNYKMHWININFRNRYSGKSNYNFLKMLLMFFNFIIKI